MDMLPAAIEALPARSFEPGDILMCEGTAESELFFLTEGSIEVRKEAEVITRIRERGAMFGEMSVLLGCPHTATVVATTKVECRVASKPIEFLKANPDVMFYVSRILARRLESLNKYLVDVKHQLREQEGHVGMIDGVLDALMVRHPRQVKTRQPAGE
ncbi:MAG: cyclic nucleotide-binding domain-containing protein [Candidatus Hydrogenedentes bacterium]|nr:cyclic nucleotide-binding domain-containing protein [Candidatus Hydrogenedentota bacterium]